MRPCLVCSDRFFILLGGTSKGFSGRPGRMGNGGSSGERSESLRPYQASAAAFVSRTLLSRSAAETAAIAAARKVEKGKSRVIGIGWPGFLPLFLMWLGGVDKEGCGMAVWKAVRGGALRMRGVTMRTGKCLCGACSYEIEGDPIIVAICHCTDCQRLTGAGHSTGAMFAESGIRIFGGPASYVLRSEAGNTVTRLFCKTCGSPLFGKNSGMPGVMTVSMGTLDSSDGMLPQVEIFVRTRRDWDHPNSALQSFDTQPSWKPENGV